MILSGTRPASHHRLPAADDYADQPRNRVFERHRADIAVSSDVEDPLRARRPCRSSIRPGARGMSSTSGQLVTLWSWRLPRRSACPGDHLSEDPRVRASSPRRASDQAQVTQVRADAELAIAMYQ